MAQANDKFTRTWIIENAVSEIRNYDAGVLTIRGLHYRLVGRGMTNTTRHYKRVVEAMVQARWDGVVPFETFSDNDRAMIGDTQSDATNIDDAIEAGKRQIQSWMTYYNKNRWENQPIYPEVFIEKKALQNVFEKATYPKRVALGACKGYPSLTFLNDTADRMIEQIENGKKAVILYFGDYDPSGEDIPRSLEANLNRLGVHDLELKRISLLEHQVIDWKLPPAPVKPGDSRSQKWEGLGQVELDAVEPRDLQKLCLDAIDDVFDSDLYDELEEQEERETEEYISEMKEYVNSIK